MIGFCQYSITKFKFTFTNLISLYSFCMDRIGEGPSPIRPRDTPGVSRKKCPSLLFIGTATLLYPPISSYRYFILAVQAQNHNMTSQIHIFHRTYAPGFSSFRSPESLLCILADSPAL